MSEVPLYGGGALGWGESDVKRRGGGLFGEGSIHVQGSLEIKDAHRPEGGLTGVPRS